MELLKDQGLCNKIYLQDSNGHLFALKECLNKEVDHRISYKIQKRLSLKKIAPSCICFDGRFIKYTYIEGEHLVSLNQHRLKRVASTLKKMHKTKVRSKRVNLKKLLPRYKYTKLQKLKKFKSNLALTHNDLNPKNLIFTKDRLYLIDFEYAGVNDIYFDLASICVEFRLNKIEQKKFLSYYFVNQNSNLKKLQLYKEIYQAGVDYWFKKH